MDYYVLKSIIILNTFDINVHKDIYKRDNEKTLF